MEERTRDFIENVNGLPLTLRDGLWCLDAFASKLGVDVSSRHEVRGVGCTYKRDNRIFFRMDPKPNDNKIFIRIKLPELSVKKALQGFPNEMVEFRRRNDPTWIIVYDLSENLLEILENLASTAYHRALT